MDKVKLYFRNENSSFCSDLESFKIDAKHEGLKEIELVQAIPDNGSSDLVFCLYHGDVEEKQLCKKSNCSHYLSERGKRKCEHKGKLFLYGDKVKIKID